MNDKQSLAHSVWRCNYHLVFVPKYRRQIIYGRYKESIGKIIRMLCEPKGVEIHEANACKDHIHLLVSIPPKLSVSSFMGYLKGKSSLMIFDQYSNLLINSLFLSRKESVCQNKSQRNSVLISSTVSTVWKVKIGNFKQRLLTYRFNSNGQKHNPKVQEFIYFFT